MEQNRCGVLEMAIKSIYPNVSIADVSCMDFVYSNFEDYGDKTAIVSLKIFPNYYSSVVSWLNLIVLTFCRLKKTCKSEEIGKFCQYRRLYYFKNRECAID